MALMRFAPCTTWLFVSTYPSGVITNPEPLPEDSPGCRGGPGRVRAGPGGGSDPCTALGEPATLVLLCGDYDGGHKAWVRWRDGADDIVPGSQVKRLG